ncbi:ABC transporter ATP-binding protein [Poseidonibacter lekithochrous]|uniref:ATP-binding cassette domain-containing protein n=1 Tax=Poseidonibacter lekithochrous TaxID=1904463 RepID=UPI0008FCC4F2|nr:ABC transporter ATP-binding protein [Poseidonibacter lekithochrous]QKJ23198.1 iron siderophore ABC transporter, ATP-binding protein [Poseidonibacter lekithochrous]
MLEINNYKSDILNNITFQLNDNDNLIILGENGAGKSTLAKVLSNLIENQDVKLFGEKLDSIADNKRATLINYIPPKLEIFDEYLTLREFMELASITSVDNEKITKLIKLLKLEKLENRYCKAFSSGEKQLLLLASSIMHDAKITIFDELTANLDISRLKEVYDILQSPMLQQKIVITHNLDLAYALKYKVLYLKDGEIEFYGEHDEFFSNENLKRFYNNTISKIDEHLVVNL